MAGGKTLLRLISNVLTITQKKLRLTHIKQADYLTLSDHPEAGAKCWICVIVDILSSPTRLFHWYFL